MSSFWKTTLLTINLAFYLVVPHYNSFYCMKNICTLHSTVVNKLTLFTWTYAKPLTLLLMTNYSRSYGHLVLLVAYESSSKHISLTDNNV